jgi:hypothetical protein
VSYREEKSGNSIIGASCHKKRAYWLISLPIVWEDIPDNMVRVKTLAILLSTSLLEITSLFYEFPTLEFVSKILYKGKSTEILGNHRFWGLILFKSIHFSTFIYI